MTITITNKKITFNVKGDIGDGFIERKENPSDDKDACIEIKTDPNYFAKNELGVDLSKYILGNNKYTQNT